MAVITTVKTMTPKPTGMPIVMTPVVVGLTWRFIFDPSSGMANYLLAVIGFGPVDGTDLPMFHGADGRALRVDDLVLVNYQHHPELRGEVAV